jgi:hypothetical protein
MLCYARSGGTLLNRCLGSIPGVVMMSEVNPCREPDRKNPLKTIQAQARAWYGIELSSAGFADSALELAAICRIRGEHLVIRDWSIVNFACGKESKGNPARRLMAHETLRDRCRLLSFAFVRDAIDVWIATGCKETFPANYLSYAKAVVAADVPVFKYEDLCADADTTLRRICACCQIPFSADYREYARYTKVTGDIATPIASRGSRHGKIVPLPRRRLPAAMVRQINGNRNIAEANALFGYDPRYEGRPRESLGGMLAERIARFGRTVGCSRRGTR